MQSINPATNEPIKDYKTHTPEEALAIVTSVSVAQKQWKETTYAERAVLLKKAATVLRENVDTYATIMTQEMGKLLTDAKAEVEKCAWVCEWYADNTESILAKEVIQTESKNSYVRFDPIGVVLAVMPWNYPFWQVFRFAAPALMAGNAGVLKHASNVPGSALAIEDVFIKAGFPKDIFRTLMISGKDVEAIIRSEHIAAVTLTGSEGAGASVAKVSGEVLKKTVLELGGSDPFIVLDDADIEIAASNAVKGRMVNMGQSCIASKRFIVMEKVAEAFEQKMVEKVKQLVIGDPMDATTQVGPMARQDLLNELHAQVSQSVAQGGELLVGGKQYGEQGAFYEPTIIRVPNKDNAVFSQETFGPVAAVIRASSIDHAIELANSSPYGLGASVWTRNTEHAEELARRIESGAVFINSIVKSDPRLPFGGVKRSGYGRELSSYGIKEFVNIKTVVVETM